jgi:hypothetical protein
VGSFSKRKGRPPDKEGEMSKRPATAAVVATGLVAGYLLGPALEGCPGSWVRW